MERGVRDAAPHLGKAVPDDLALRELGAANLALLTEDLPALRERRTVKPGIFDRVFNARVKHSAGADYVREMLTVYARVEDDVAAALEG